MNVWWLSFTNRASFSWRIRHFPFCMSGSRPKKSAGSMMRDVLPMHLVHISTKMQPSKIPINLLFICSGMCFLREFSKMQLWVTRPPSVWQRVIIIISFGNLYFDFYIQSPFSFVMESGILIFMESGVLLESAILIFLEGGFLFYIHHNSKNKKIKNTKY